MYFCAIMRLFEGIWGVWAILFFLLLMTLSLPWLLVNALCFGEKEALKRNIYFLHRVFSPVFLTLIGIRLRVDGLEHVSTDQPYVLISNHRSILDFIINAVAFPGVFRFLAKHELRRIPVFGWVVQKMCLTVDRANTASRVQSVVELKKALLDGWSIFIYPEGSRNKTREPLAPFYDGAFRIALECQTPVLAQTLLNVQNRTQGLYLRPGVVHVVWCKPVLPAQHDAASLKEAVRTAMLDVLQNHHPATA